MSRFLNFIVHDPFALLVPVVLLVGTVISGFIVRRVFFGLVRRWATRTNSQLDILIIDSLRTAILLWAVILGLHLATQNSKIPRVYLHYIPSVLGVLWILSLTMVAAELAGNLIRYYGSAGNGNAREVTSLTQKFAQLVVVILGFVAVLKVVFNISPTTIVTTLGVGGLAVALALQDTLSNLFTGFWVSVSGLIRIGDYIKLNSGEEGTIADINWRCTLLRGPNNNLIVVPNSKLGQANVTNYFLPERQMSVSINCSVGYDSDIDRVEEMLLDEAKKGVHEIPGAAADVEPYIRFTPGPGDSALVFQVNFSVTEFSAQWLAMSEMRKRVFKRLKAEGVTMPFPTRTVILEDRNASGARAD